MTSKIGPAVVALGLASAAALAGETKSFSNAKYGFQLSYPVQWTVGGQTEHDLLETDKHPKGVQNAFAFQCEQARSCLVTVAVHDAKPQTFEQFQYTKDFQAAKASKQPNYMNPTSFKKITVNGQEGYEYVYGDGTFFGKTRLVVFFHGGRRYDVLMAGGPHDGDYDKATADFDAVLGSLRFSK